MRCRGVDQVTKSFQGAGIAAAVEDGPFFGQGTEQAIKPEKSNTEVLVHEPFVVQSPVVDVMRVACRYEPTFQPRIRLHPKARDMHTVM